MKKLLVLIIIVLISLIPIAYAEDTPPADLGGFDFEDGNLPVNNYPEYDAVTAGAAVDENTGSFHLLLTTDTGTNFGKVLVDSLVANTNWKTIMAIDKIDERSEDTNTVTSNGVVLKLLSSVDINNLGGSTGSNNLETWNEFDGVADFFDNYETTWNALVNNIANNQFNEASTAITSISNKVRTNLDTLRGLARSSDPAIRNGALGLITQLQNYQSQLDELNEQLANPDSLTSDQITKLQQDIDLTTLSLRGIRDEFFNIVRNTNANRYMIDDATGRVMQGDDFMGYYFNMGGNNNVFIEPNGDAKFYEDSDWNDQGKGASGTDGNPISTIDDLNNALATDAFSQCSGLNNQWCYYSYTTYELHGDRTDSGQLSDADRISRGGHGHVFRTVNDDGEDTAITFSEDGKQYNEGTIGADGKITPGSWENCPNSDCSDAINARHNEMSKHVLDDQFSFWAGSGADDTGVWNVFFNDWVNVAGDLQRWTYALNQYQGLATWFSDEDAESWIDPDSTAALVLGGVDAWSNEMCKGEIFDSDTGAFALSSVDHGIGAFAGASKMLMPNVTDTGYEGTPYYIYKITHFIAAPGCENVSFNIYLDDQPLYSNSITNNTYQRVGAAMLIKHSYTDYTKICFKMESQSPSGCLSSGTSWQICNLIADDAEIPLQTLNDLGIGGENSTSGNDDGWEEEDI